MSATGISLFALEGIPLISNGDDLGAIIAQALTLPDQKPEDGDILVLAQKIISKAEGRAVHLDTVNPSAEARKLADEVDKDPRLMELILGESRQVIRKKPGVVIVEHRLGYVLARARDRAAPPTKLENRHMAFLRMMSPNMVGKPARYCKRSLGA